MIENYQGEKKFQPKAKKKMYNVTLNIYHKQVILQNNTYSALEISNRDLLLHVILLLEEGKQGL